MIRRTIWNHTRIRATSSLAALVPLASNRFYSRESTISREEINLVNKFLPYAKRNTIRSKTSQNFYIPLTHNAPKPKIDNLEEEKPEPPSRSQLQLQLQTQTQTQAKDIASILSNHIDSRTHSITQSPVLNKLVLSLIDIGNRTTVTPTGLNSSVYTSLIYYCSRYGDSSQVSQLIKMMIVNDDLKPTAEIFNYAIMSVSLSFSSSQNKNQDLGLINRYLQGIMSSHLKLTPYTWYLIFIVLKDVQLKSEIIQEMIKLKIDFRPICHAVIEWGLESKGSHSGFVDWLRKLNANFDLGYIFNNTTIFKSFMRLPLDKTVDDDTQESLQEQLEQQEGGTTDGKFPTQELNLKIKENQDVNEIIEVIINNYFRLKSSNSGFDSQKSEMLLDYLISLPRISKQGSSISQNSWKNIIQFYLDENETTYLDVLFKNYSNSFTYDVSILTLLIKYALSATDIHSKEIAIVTLEKINLTTPLKTNYTIWNTFIEYMGNETRYVQLQLSEEIMDHDIYDDNALRYAIETKYNCNGNIKEILAWLLNKITVTGKDFPQVCEYIVNLYLDDDNYPEAVKFINEYDISISLNNVTWFSKYFKRHNLSDEWIVFLKLYIDRNSITKSEVLRHFKDSDIYQQYIYNSDDEKKLFNSIKKKFILEFDQFNDTITELDLFNKFMEIVSPSFAGDNQTIENYDIYQNTIVNEKTVRNLDEDHFNKLLNYTTKQEGDIDEILQTVLGNSIEYNYVDRSTILEFIGSLKYNQLNDHSITSIFQFLSLSFRSNVLFNILEQLKTTSFQLNTDQLNCVLFSALNTKTLFSKNNVTFKSLSNFQIGDIKPDWSTWFIFFKGIDDISIKISIINKMIENRVPLMPIIKDVILTKHAEFKNVEKVITWLHLNSVIDNEIEFHPFVVTPIFECLLNDGNPIDALIWIMKSGNPEQTLTMSRADKLIEHYLNNSDIVDAFIILDIYKRFNRPYEKGVKKVMNFAIDNDQLRYAKFFTKGSKLNKEEQLIKEKEIVPRINEFSKLERIVISEEQAKEEALQLLKSYETINDSLVYSRLSMNKPEVILHEDWKDEPIEKIIPGNKSYSNPETSSIVQHLSTTNYYNTHQLFLEFITENGYFNLLSSSTQNIQPSTDALNLLIYSDLKTKGYYNLIIHLKQFRQFKLQPDLSTWYIIYNSLDSFWLKDEYLKEIKKIKNHCL